MNIRKIVDDYIECNSFEIKIKDKKAWFYYYDTVKNFSSTNIEIIKDNNVYKVKGKKLVIESMFKEFLVISGSIDSINLG